MPLRSTSPAHTACLRGRWAWLWDRTLRSYRSDSAYVPYIRHIWCVRCMLSESHWCTCSLSNAHILHVVHTLHAEYACTVSVVQCFTSHTSSTVVITVDNIVVVTVITLCVQEVCGWINEKASIPVWAKMTPNITDITFPARTALNAGCEGVAAINTIQSVMGVNLKTLRPEPSVEGYSTPGGYSSVAVKPIALAKVNCCVRCTACVYASALQASFLLGAASFLAQKFSSARFAKCFVWSSCWARGDFLR